MNLGDSVRTTQCKCPICWKKLDAATATQKGTKPKAGDATVCICCGALLVFNDDLTVRLPTDEENDIMRFDERVLKLQRMIRTRRR